MFDIRSQSHNIRYFAFTFVLPAIFHMPIMIIVLQQQYFHSLLLHKLARSLTSPYRHNGLSQEHFTLSVFPPRYRWQGWSRLRLSALSA